MLNKLGLALAVILVPVAGHGAAIEPISPRLEVQSSQVRNDLATLAERQRPLRPLLDGDRPFVSAKIAGPFQYNTLFSGPQTHYCVQVEMGQLLANILKEIRTVVIRVGKTPEGKTLYTVTEIGVSGNVPTACLAKKYEPFPELLQARLRRIRTKS